MHGVTTLLALATALTPLSTAQPQKHKSPNPDHGNGHGRFRYEYNYCPAANWPTYGPGYDIQSQDPSDLLKQAMKEVDAGRIEEYIEKLVSFGTRATLSVQDDPEFGIGAARRYIADTMRGFAEESDGRMEVTTPFYTQEPDGSRILFPVDIYNVEATITGSESPERYYVVSGHYDSRNTNATDFTGDAPGANDDASGTAIAMELARILAKYEPKSTIVLTAVAGEEQGLYGADFQAATYRNNSINMAGMLNADTVGSSTGDDGFKDPYSVRVFCQGIPPLEAENATIRNTRLTVGGENDSPARNLGRFIVETSQNMYTGMQNIALIYRLDRFLRGGDHSAYIDNGYLNAVRFTEPNENFDHQHQDIRVEDGTQYGDLIEFVDFDYVARNARVLLSSVWSLSEAPSVPDNVYVDTSDLSNDSTFVWSAVPEEVAGYEVVWRATNAPFWTHAIPVGQGEDAGDGLRTATVDLSKDNVVFGVRSVGTDGLKSPATFAGFPL
ncbi:hypothetical protein MBLNU230_g3557t1 [Neophaeotheca triangularis]